MAAKRKAKTEVTYDVEFRYGEWLPWSFDHRTLKGAKKSARECACATRIVRVEALRTVVAEAKP